MFCIRRPAHGVWSGSGPEGVCVRVSLRLRASAYFWTCLEIFFSCASLSERLFLLTTIPALCPPPPISRLFMLFCLWLCDGQPALCWLATLKWNFNLLCWTDKGLCSIFFFLFYLPQMKHRARSGNWQAGAIPGLHVLSSKHKLFLIKKKKKNENKQINKLKKISSCMTGQLLMYLRAGRCFFSCSMFSWHLLESKVCV